MMKKVKIYYFIILTHLNDALIADMARTLGMLSQLRDHFDPK